MRFRSLIFLLVFLLSHGAFANEKTLAEETFGPDLRDRWKLNIVPNLKDETEPPASLEPGSEGTAVVTCAFRHAEGMEGLNREGIYPNYLKLESPKITSELSGPATPGTTLKIRMKGTGPDRAFRVFLLTEDDRIFLISNGTTKLGVEFEEYAWDLTDPETFSEIRRTTGSREDAVDKQLIFPLKTFALEIMGFSGPSTEGAPEKIEIQSVSFTSAP